MQSFIGTGVALVTPFKKDFSVDVDALTRIVNYVIEGGVEYLVVLGTTAETATLSQEEKEKIKQEKEKQRSLRNEEVTTVNATLPKSDTKTYMRIVAEEKKIIKKHNIDIINTHAEKITLISAGIYSAAFYIFFFAKCRRKIIYGSIGMHHREYLKDIYINEKGKPKYQEDICQIENLKCVRNNFLEKAMTKKEKFLYNNDDDVYFTFNRMKELFPNVEIIE